ncbi:hypothetical protein KP509_09G076300 [Ceratopteris richardii]|nr:hypothetical protein KP509_09G076300 [Ceratopteris richardii]
MHCLNSSIEARSYFPTETTTYVWRNNGELRSPSSISAESVENMCDQQISLVRPKETGSISSSAGTDTIKILEGEHSDEASGDVSSHPVREDESLLNAGRYVLNSLSNSYYTVLLRSSWLWSRLSVRQEQFGRANTIWSLALTSLTMGIVFLGRSWKHLQLQNRSFRAELLAKEKVFIYRFPLYFFHASASIAPFPGFAGDSLEGL